MIRRLLSGTIYFLSGIIGVLAFTYPFLLPTLNRLGAGSSSALSAAAHQSDAPLLTFIMLVLCLGVLLIEIQGQAVSAKVVAALGILVAITAVLRFLEVAIPGPGGFSLIFAPLIIAGYVFGARFGFLMGTMSMLVSALVTGNVGPWLPYQMFAAGWVGLSAGWLPRVAGSKRQIAMLAAFSFIWGLLFGAIMNLYFWPFISGADGLGWEPGIGIGESVRRYFGFYLATSVIWDLGRSFGNAVLIVVLGMPTVRALSRFRDRFEFKVT